MQKAEKHDFVKNFNESLKNKEFLVVAHYKGLNVKELDKIRDGTIKEPTGKFVV